jgi:hypothetical protein
MAFFLNEQRRSCLISNLCQLSMPRVIAEDYSSISDGNLTFIDKYVSACVWRIAERCERLHEPATAHNRQLAASLETLLAADTLILAAYTGEMKQRQLPDVMFSRTCKALDNQR